MQAELVGDVGRDAYDDILAGGRERARAVVVRPGGKVATRGHDSRPAVVHVLEGEFVEHRNDSPQPLVRRAGDTCGEGPGTVHWLQNVSSVPERIFAVDIQPPPPGQLPTARAFGRPGRRRGIDAAPAVCQWPDSRLPGPKQAALPPAGRRGTMTRLRGNAK